MSIGYRDYEDVAALRGTIAGAAGLAAPRYNLSGAGDPSELIANHGEPESLHRARVRPILWAGFGPAEEPGGW